MQSAFGTTSFRLTQLTCLIAIIFLTSSTIKPVESDVILLIDLWNYTNPSGSLYTGKCCDSNLQLSDCSLLNKKCTVRLKICIDSADRKNEISNPDSCYYASTVLNGIRDINTFNFRENPQAKQPFIFSLAWNQVGLPRFLIKFFAIDDSSVGQLVARRATDKLIDSYILDFNTEQTIEPSNGLSNRFNWNNFPAVQGVHSNDLFKTFISFSIAMKCSTNYYTPSCNVRCVQQDSCHGGHYTCDPLTGNKICNAGFTDPSTNCMVRDTSVQLCDKSDNEFCTNNGVCYQNLVQLVNVTFPTCCCNQGFGGSQCSDIISCNMNTCKNGGICSFNVTEGLGKCICKLGYKGKYCETKIVCPEGFYGEDCTVRCQATDTCEKHETCDFYGKLKCKEGWGSFPGCNVRLIDQSIDPECPMLKNSTGTNTPCFNGGSCSMGKCCCPPGFTGDHCETNVNQCLSSPCLNGALCLPSSSGFSCVCLPGYSGLLCETLIDPCKNSSLQCSGVGMCVPFSNYTGFYCSCNEGYTGNNCEIPIDNCQSKPCLNNATCISVQLNYYCSCTTGYTGFNCENQVDFCTSQPCVHGTCTSLPNGYICDCDPGWTNRQTCNEDINECTTNNFQPLCQNNGVCLNTPGSYQCQCPTEYSGPNCEVRIDYCSRSTCDMSQTKSCENDYQQKTFSCNCFAGFTGNNCEVDINECASQPCKNGNCQDLVNGYKCENCALLGFTGPQCDIPIDYCSSSPCVANQVLNCVNYQTNYKCLCKNGYTGVNCEIDIDECASNPCLNNSPCIDEINGYKCLCQDGFEGQICAGAVNPCQINANTNNTKCGSNGLCFPNGNSFFCQCFVGYEGTYCETQTSICNLYKPCVNGATCLDNGSTSDFTCICPSGFTGKSCETKIDSCTQGPVMNKCNSGTCVNLPSGNRNYTCLCPVGFTGDSCQTTIDQCTPNKCAQNQGTCQSIYMLDGTPNFQCICLPGYTGNLCDITIDQCLNQPCQNGGTCQSLIGYHRCICPPNYHGLNCQLFNKCSSSPCSREGTSQCLDTVSASGDSTGFTCVCRLGFTGTTCEISTNECLSHPCKNNATCIDLVDSYACQCTGFFEGTLCENPFNFCANNPCADGSTCISMATSFQCQCPLDKTGVLCDQSKDACALLPCKNSGQCVNKMIDYECNCVSGFTGKDCSIVIDYCVSPKPCSAGSSCLNSCQNGATCASSDIGITCKCPVGYTGSFCENKIDFCQIGVPCLNGGTCSTTASGFKCLCANGFTGARCDAIFDNCKPDSCKNDGICRTAQDGSISCTCTPGFTGNFCENSINKCLEKPCQNGGTCLILPGSYLCTCPSNYRGSNCEVKIDFCSSSPCRNGGLCVDGEFGFTCQCLSGFTGEICQTKNQACGSSPCSQGTCINTDTDYQCNCFTGFTGKLCQTQIDWCSIPTLVPVCKNNGICVNTLSGVSCRCLAGYTGNNCEILSDACAAKPCVRGNCTTQPGSYKCSCPNGFTGTNCETDINECSESAPICYNNSTCINTVSSYVCQCLNGYTGRQCELGLDSCFSNPCMNSGYCNNLMGGLFACNCLPGYLGNRCEVINDPCNSNPCKNNGATCTSLSPTQFSCLCPPGLTGQLCEQNVNPCTFSNCQHNSTCINLSTPQNQSSFICACQPGYSGKQCETYTNPCQSQVRCINGGTCQVNGGSFNCLCPPGFKGVNCEIVNSCLSTPCKNGGGCTSLEPNGYQCLCSSGFTGPNCEIKRSVCSPSPCLNFGLCKESYNGGFECICTPGTTGSRCETNITECSNVCKFGQCVFQNGVNTCVCVPGYTGANCETDINECDPNPCSNGAACSQPFINMYSCLCPPGFTGQNCDLKPQICDTRPCLNGGQCQPVGDSFVCNCLAGTTGTNCETRVNECVSRPCQNGGLCVDGVNQYTCKCMIGFQGVNCEIDINECQSNPCSSNAICTTPQVNMYQCTCQNGYSGPNCDIFTSVCASNPCSNGATCTTTVQNTFMCVCPAGYTGNLCQNRLDECSNKNCYNNFTGQVLNIYANPEQVIFDSYRNCILNAWISANPSISNSMSNNIVLTQESIKPSIEFTTNVYANHTTTLTYSISILSPTTSFIIRTPSPSELKNQCPFVVLNPVTTYENYWDVYLCGFYNTGSDLEAIRSILMNAWATKYADINSQLNVDIFMNKIEQTSSEGQSVTRLQYLVYLSNYKLLIEKGKFADMNKIPSDSEITSALSKNNYKSCKSLILKPVTFSITLCGIIKRSDRVNILNKLQLAWQSDFTNGGGVGNNKVDIYYSSDEEYYSETVNGPATKFHYTVFVNSQQIDSGFSISYDHEKIKESFKKNFDICKANYAVANSFNIITSNKVCDYNVAKINLAMSKLVLPNVPANAQIVFVSYGVEEVIDDYSRKYYSLPFFVIVDNQFMDPANNRGAYDAILIGLSTVIANPPYEKFQVYSTNNNNYYRTALAFKFYFNTILPKKSLNLVSNYIKQAYLTSNQNSTRSKVAIRLQQDVILQNQNQNAKNINQLLAFISNENNELYDARREPLSQITFNLKSLLNSLGTPIMSGSKKVELLENTIESNLIYYKDLFVMYVQNTYLEIPPKDIIKISSWLNNHWHTFSNNSQAIGIINSQIYFDQGKLVIGINYKVHNQNPQCGDFSYLEHKLQNSFVNDLMNKLCQANYMYYKKSQGSQPTKSFFTLDLIGNVNGNEPVHQNIVQTGLLNAWSKEYSGFSNISKPLLSTRYFERIGTLGTVLSRVYYTISIDGQQVVTNFQSAPSMEKVEKEFNALGSDFRVYPSCNSLPKSLFSSLYIKSYPLNADDRQLIEMNIRTALTYMSFIQPNVKNTITIGFSELYRAQTFGYNVSRVYYTLHINDNLVYPCDLSNIYATSLNSIPTSTAFDYMIKSRYIDIIIPESNRKVYIQDLLHRIQNTWFYYQNSPNSNVTEFEVKLADSIYYTSKFQPIIERVYYFLTIGNKNVNDNDGMSVNYKEPTMTYFNNYLSPNAIVSFYMPLKALRVYLEGSLDSIDINTVQTNLTAQWATVNPQFLFSNMIETKSCEETNKIVKVNSVLNPKTLNFYNSLKSNYSNITRIIYSGLFNSFADQHDLFTKLPANNVNQQTTIGNAVACNDASCIPSLFYDFYIDKPVSEKENLVFGIRNAWFEQNDKLSDLNFQNYLDIKMYSVIPFCSRNSSKILYRVYYSAGLKNRYQHLDITDFVDPSDQQYKANLADKVTVINRADYSNNLIPCSVQSASIDDKVEGIKWWMILIIAIAALLLLILLLLLLFCLKTRRGLSNGTMQKSDSIYNLINKNELSRMTDLNSTKMTSKNNTYRASTNDIKSVNTIKSASNDKEMVYSFRSKGIDSNNLSNVPEASLNQPQQYEATIN